MNKVKIHILLEFLRQENKITPAVFAESEEMLLGDKNPLDELAARGALSLNDLDRALLQYMNVSYVDIDMVEIQTTFSSFLGSDVLQDLSFIPLYRFGNGMWIVGATNPNDPVLLNLLRATLDDNFSVVKVDQEKIDKFVTVYNASNATKMALESIKNDTSLDSSRRKDVSAEVANAPAVRFIDSTLEEAVRIGASDIHIEPGEELVRVRYRVDGDLRSQSTFDIGFFPAVSTRIKILADIDIAEKRIPQDGHISKIVDGERYDFRVSTLPTVHGEKFVIRVLDKKIFSLSLSELNFAKDVTETIDKILSHPHGIILLTGPTGSGKTTTLYSFLRELNTPDVNIVTIEDPVEFSFEEINQVQVNTKAELTFASSLRSILRQDPDIIMVGEIRDEETAQIAIRAAITGHLVLSTLHTNEAPGAVTRLIDMGVPSYLVSDALVAVISQRLIKRLCPHCKKPVKPTAEQQRRLRIGKNDIIYEANGCPYCNNSGYKGRMAVHEIMYLNDDIKEVIARKDASIEDIRRVAITKAGMVPLIGAARRYVLSGETAYADLLSMIVTDERETKE